MNYKFISWNIDSLNAALTGTSERAALSLAVVKNLAQAQPDVLAIQETKLPSTGPKKAHLEVLEELFKGYKIVWRSSVEPARKGYSGTMILWSRILLMITEGINYSITINDTRTGNQYQRKLDRTTCGIVKA